MFANLILGFDWTPYRQYLPYVVGCGVAIVVFMFYASRIVMANQSKSDDATNLRPRSNPEIDGKDFGDRRNSLRREGQPVPVLVSSPAFPGVTAKGRVMDRSTGGVRVELDSPVVPGTALQLLAENAPDTTPWVTAVVRSCKSLGKKYELGCEFEVTPPWNVLLLFG